MDRNEQTAALFRGTQSTQDVFFGAARAPEMCPDGTLCADYLVISVRYLYHSA